MRIRTSNECNVIFKNVARLANEAPSWLLYVVYVLSIIINFIFYILILPYG